MTYVNPIEILDIGRLNPIDIDSSLIKKKKRILIADIDLSDDSSFNYHSYKITRSDCEKAIEELENKNKLEFYFHLANNKELNSFLANGDTKHLDKLKHESIYALPEFIEFISPFVSFRINQSLLKSFENADYELFCLSLSLEYLISKDYHIKAYSGLGNEIKQRIDEIDILKEEIKITSSMLQDGTKADDKFEELNRQLEELQKRKPKTTVIVKEVQVSKKGRKL